MKRLFFLFLTLNIYYLKFFPLQKIKGIFVNIFFLFEYFYLFLCKNYFFYKFYLKEKDYRKKEKDYRKKEKIKNENKYVSRFWYFYYRRRMYFGIGVVYFHMFLRRVKEIKNYLIYIVYYRYKRLYADFKESIMDYTCLFFTFNNFRLMKYFLNLKKKMFYFFFYSNCIVFFIKIKIKKKLWSICKEGYLFFTRK